MTKITARNAEFFAGYTDLTGRTNQITLSATAEAPDVTTFKSDVVERLADGLKDGELSGAGFFDPDDYNVDHILSGLFSSSTTYGFYPTTASTGNTGYEMGGVLTDYTPDFSTAEAAVMSYTISASGDIIRGVSFGYGNLATVTGGAAASGYLNSGCSVDFGGSTANGELIVRIPYSATASAFSFSGSFQHSNDDSAFTTISEFSITQVGFVHRELFSSACQYRRVKYSVSGSGTWTAQGHGFAGSKIS